MIKKFASLVKRGSKSGELDNLLVLQRCIYLIMIPYTILIGAALIADNVIPFALGAFFCSFAFIVYFVMSFFSDPRFIAVVSAILLDTFAILYSLAFGAAASFHQLLFLSLFVFWYDITRGLFRKILLSVLTGAAICWIRAAEQIDTLLRFRSSDVYALMTYTNNLICVIGLSLIAYFFCTQFAEAERKLYLSNRELRKMSHTDPLTKLMNRRFAEEEFKVLEKNYEKDGNLISVAIGDIDFFKKVNDTYGHDAGDYVLASLSAVFEDFMKQHGFVVRWGGEEFLFVFEQSNGDDTYLALEQLRQIIEDKTMHYQDKEIRVTMTFGVEEYGPILGMDSAIADADKKLYLGKESGRNRVMY